MISILVIYPFFTRNIFFRLKVNTDRTDVSKVSITPVVVVAIVMVVVVGAVLVIGGVLAVMVRGNRRRQ